MTSFGQKVRGRREELGLTQVELGKAAGLSYQAIQQIEDGTSKSTRKLLELARALEVPPDWLTSDVDTPPPPKDKPNIKSAQSLGNFLNLAPMPLDLPILGMAECGPDGWSLWNGDVVDMIARPPNLAGVPNAYGVYVVGDSMEPRYYAGEVAHVHPAKPVAPGNFVLVQCKPADAGEGPKAVIKRLVRRSGKKVVLEQLNPPKMIELDADQIMSMHRIVGSSDG